MVLYIWLILVFFCYGLGAYCKERKLSFLRKQEIDNVSTYMKVKEERIAATEKRQWILFM